MIRTRREGKLCVSRLLNVQADNPSRRSMKRNFLLPSSGTPVAVSCTAAAAEDMLSVSHRCRKKLSCLPQQAMAAEQLLDLAQRLSRELTEANGRLSEERQKLSKALEDERSGLREELQRRQLRIEEERSALGYDQERLDVLTGHREPEDDILALNVGGEAFMTRRSTLCVFEDSYLSNLFSGRWESSIEKDSADRYFLDFDPVCFRLLLNFLRTKRFESQRAPFPLPKVPSEKEEQFWHLVEYFGLLDAFQEAEEAASACAAARPKSEDGPTTSPPLGASLIQSAGALIRTLRQAAGEAAAAAEEPPVPAPELGQQGAFRDVPASRALGPILSESQAQASLLEDATELQSPTPAASTSFLSAASQQSAPSSTPRTPGWSRKVAHRLVTVEEDSTTLHIGNSRAAASAAAARASRGFRAGRHAFEVKVLLCSDWSYIGLVSDEWTSLTVPVGRSDHSWGIASGGTLFAGGREVGRVEGYGLNSCLRWVVDMDTRAAAVAIDGHDFGEVFSDLPATVFPAASNCRAPARYNITFLGEVAQP